MTAVSSEVQTRAREAQRVCDTGAVSATVAGAAAFGTGAVLAPPFAVLAALMVAGSYILRRWAEDPPRADYMLPVRVRPTGLLMEPVPDAPVALEIRVCADCLATSSRLLEAALLAFEREQGARLADAFDDAADRADERRRLQRDAAAMLRATQHAFDDLVSAMDSHRDLWTGGDAVPADRVEDLSDAMLAWLYRAGVPLADVSRALELAREGSAELRDPDGVLADLGAVGEAYAALAEALDGWEPEPAETAVVHWRPAGPRGGRNVAFEDDEDDELDQLARESQEDTVDA